MQTTTIEQKLATPERIGPAPHVVELDALLAEVAATHPTMIYTLEDDDDARHAFDAAIFAALVAP